jgi:hypothetical protein
VGDAEGASVGAAVGAAVGAWVTTVSIPLKPKPDGSVAFLLETAFVNDAAKLVELEPIDETDEVAVLPWSAVNPVMTNWTAIPAPRRLMVDAAFLRTLLGTVSPSVSTSAVISPSRRPLETVRDMLDKRTLSFVAKDSLKACR